MVLPTFRLTETNAQAVAEICRRLDGIPLAIELAAVRVSTLPVETIAARLDDRFRLLGEDNRRALPRHKTLRALIDWSYEQLALSERLLLRRLAIFAGGWTIASAEGVCGDGENSASPSRLTSTAHSTLPTSEVLTSLFRLTGKSLVVLDERDGVARYRMLETIHQYALEELQKANEVDLLGERHLHYFLDLAAQSEPLFNRGQRFQWVQQLGG
jgi:predicted ATPase